MLNKSEVIYAWERIIYVHIYELWISFLENEKLESAKSIVVSGNSKGELMGWIGSTETSFSEWK